MRLALRTLLSAGFLIGLLAQVARAQYYPEMYEYQELTRYGPFVFAYAETDISYPSYDRPCSVFGWSCWEEYASYTEVNLFKDNNWRGGYWYEQPDGGSYAWYYDDAEVGTWHLEATHTIYNLWWLNYWAHDFWEPWMYDLSYSYLQIGAQNCAVPVNFRQSSTPFCNQATGVLSFVYTWDSPTGNRQDLAGCNIREVVRYENNGTPPSPPFPQYTFQNPTVLQGQATDEVSTDAQLPPSGLFVPPYSESAFYARQSDEYNCQCQGTQDWTPFSGFRDLEIERKVTNVNGTWKYVVRKLGQSCSLSLPQQ